MSYYSGFQIHAIRTELVNTVWLAPFASYSLAQHLQGIHFAEQASHNRSPLYCNPEECIAIPYGVLHQNEMV